MTDNNSQALSFQDQENQDFMQQAIHLAEHGLYSTMPNPRVGCVIVKDGIVLGEGFHEKAGFAHAEVEAIAAVKNNGDSCDGATAYVTLEPCSHQGKTPPCCDALIEAGITRVVYGMQDPNPQVAGRGLNKLREAGVEVDGPVLESEAEALNPGFIKRMKLDLPFVHAKSAISLDGRTAMANGESQWITGAEARSQVQRIRARSCAIISGVNTVLMDEASLTVRAADLGLPSEQAAIAEKIAERQPLRVVVDSTLRLTANAKLFKSGGKVLVVAAEKNEMKQKALEVVGAEVVYLPNAQQQVDLLALMQLLAKRECNEVMVEAGATLQGAFLELQLIDRLTTFIAPILMGQSARPMFAMGFEAMEEKIQLTETEVETVGDDIKISGLVAYSEMKSAH